MTKTIITVATTGAWPKKENNPNVPMTPAEISEDVYACWKAGAAAEVIGLPAGTIGERLYTAKVYLQTPGLFAWTVVILVLSALFEKVFLAVVDALAGKVGG